MKTKPNMAASAAVGGAGIGMIVVQVFFSNTNIEVGLALSIISHIWFLLSLIFSLGSVNILKYYYCRKYGFEEVYKVRTPSKKELEARRRKTKRRMAIAILIPIALIVLIVLASLLDRLMGN